MNSILLLTHITGAVVGISSGFLSMIFRKGASLHRLAGNIFFGSMLAMSGSAAYLAVFHKPNHVNLLAGLLTFYLVATAWQAAKRRDGRTSAFDVAALAWTLIAAMAAFAFAINPTKDSPAAACVIFGIFALLFAVADIRLLAHGAISGAKRIRRHLWRMCVALLFALFSFFPGQVKLFPPEVRRMAVLYLPHVLLVASMIYWLTVRRHADLPAILQHRAGRALRQPSRADVLPERHEEAVDVDPILARQLPLEGAHRPLR